MHCWDDSLHIACLTHQVKSSMAYTPLRVIHHCCAGRFLAFQRLYACCLVLCTQLPPQRSLLKHQQLFTSRSNCP